jgi:hypothetical protein
MIIWHIYIRIQYLFIYFDKRIRNKEYNSNLTSVFKINVFYYAISIYIFHRLDYPFNEIEFALIGCLLVIISVIYYPLKYKYWRKQYAEVYRMMQKILGKKSRTF